MKILSKATTDLVGGGNSRFQSAKGNVHENAIGHANEVMKKFRIREKSMMPRPFLKKLHDLDE